MVLSFISCEHSDVNVSVAILHIIMEGIKKICYNCSIWKSGMISEYFESVTYEKHAVFNCYAVREAHELVDKYFKNT